MSKKDVAIDALAVLITIGVTVFFIAGTASVGFVAYTEATDETDYDYQYTVKADQIGENEMFEDRQVTPYQNLSENEQKMLFEAYKQSDGFLEESETIVTVDEPMENVTMWQAVNVKGVPMFIGITGPEKVISDSDSWDFLIVLVGSLLFLLFGYFSAGLLKKTKDDILEFREYHLPI